MMRETYYVIARRVFCAEVIPNSQLDERLHRCNNNEITGAFHVEWFAL